MRQRLWFGALLSAALCSCCHADGTDVNGDRTGSQILVNVLGKPSAFAGRTIDVGGRLADPPGAAPEGNLQTELTICTADRQRFLTNPYLTIIVTMPDGSKVTSVVERIACRFSADPGEVERVFVRIEEDGKIDSTFGINTTVYSSCARPGRPGLCPKDDF